MLESTFTNLSKKLVRYKTIADLISILKKTPESAVHWYMIMVISLIVVILNVSVAWIVFRSVAAQGGDIFNQMTNATTINRTDLQKALDSYRLQEAELKSLKANPVNIIDPGR